MHPQWGLSPIVFIRRCLMRLCSDPNFKASYKFKRHWLGLEVLEASLEQSRNLFKGQKILFYQRLRYVRLNIHCPSNWSRYVTTSTFCAEA